LVVRKPGTNIFPQVIDLIPFGSPDFSDGIVQQVINDPSINVHI